ncbi:chloramphenicol phosphotransferase [Fusarium longipes]|uniref:Chloramphenicol phosphotransferase n=1 Tax=Fusarium longipes TaxID=694270 RepID=A0A395RH99_9HYPO|nr:chloramphenicol phosphotransferase [Fusarium longipes]
MAVVNGTVEAPVDATPKGKVIVLNGASASTKTAILERLGSQLTGYKTYVVDSYIMTKPSSPDMLGQELRSVYIQEVLKSADQGHTILLTACLLDDFQGRRDTENILSIFAGKQIPLVWVNADFEPRDSEHCCISMTSSRATHSDTIGSMAVLPSRKRHGLKDTELVTRTLTAEHSIQEAVQELLSLMGLAR